MPAYADIIENQTATENADFNKGNFTHQRKVSEDVVVSGMSGRFPQSANVKEFSKNLYEHVDMITEDDRRWTPGLHGLPTRSGKLLDLSHFDASFFSVSPRQAHCMDPQLRLLLEVTYEAIFDAGVHPSSLKGKRVGVYVGVSGSETEEFITSDPEKITGYELTGCCRAMFANRISYALDVKGPSFAVDTACSSALIAFYTAWNSIMSGEIDAAIVAGSNLTLKPQSSMQFNALNMLSKDGRCKAFDSRANGYVRSEAVSAVFLQKRKDAPRFYAQVVQALANTDGFKNEGITFPSGEVQRALLEEVYRRAGVDPSEVSYVEAHGTGTKAGDPQEVGAITEVFCAKRSDPLLLGSVKSNMGHSEPASGLCALIKILLSYQNREIPANLHFESPNPDLPSLCDGRIKVVSQNTPWKGQYAAVNCFGFGGANAHVLLKACENSVLTNTNVLKAKNSSYNLVMSGGPPRLFFTSGRTEQHVVEVLSEFENNRNTSFATLFDNINECDSSAVSFPYRGYTVIGGVAEEDRQMINISECPSEEKPLWLIFSGMGSQWKGCGRALLNLPPFENVIQRIRSVMLPLGVDLLDILTREEPDPLTSITASFTAIASVQVGLMEVLKSVGLTKYDGLIGHSVGELGCAYADGALTAEQTVLAAYWRGKSVEEAGLPSGAMIAVGLGVEDAEKWIEKGSSVIVACRNSSNSVTLSGPKSEVEAVKEKLDAEGVFCRAVNSGGIAFHHTNLKTAAPRLLAELHKIILSPLRRSAKWVSTSVLEDNWGCGIAQKASAEYWVNNLVSPVLFAEALAKVPEEARVIEVSPHALMQAILRRALPSCSQFPLLRKESKDVLVHFLEALGKLYCSGCKINMKPLHSSVTFPVELETPSIGHLIRWDHEVEWDVAKISGSGQTAEFKVDVDLNDPSMSYIEGHAIDGRVLFPATGYMTLAWRALAKLLQKKIEEVPVTFTDVTLHQATVLSATNAGVSFTVRLLLNKGEFEVLAGETLAASGQIHAGVKDSSERTDLKNRVLTNSRKKEQKKSIKLDHSEVYKELVLRGYQYNGVFRGVKWSNLEGTQGQLMWKDNWISLLDTVLQFSLIGSPLKGLYLPTRLRKVHIEPSLLLNAVVGEENLLTVRHSRPFGVTMCPGVEVYGLKATLAPRRAPLDNPVLEGYQFYPNCLSEDHQIARNLDYDNAVKIMTDIVLENLTSIKIRIGHILGHEKPSEVSVTALPSALLNTFDSYPLLSSEYTMKSYYKLDSSDQEKLASKDIEIIEQMDVTSVAKMNLLVLSHPVLEPEDLSLISSIDNGAFILVDNQNLVNILFGIGLVQVASNKKFNLFLLRKPNFEKDVRIMNIDGLDEKFTWVDNLQEELKSESKAKLWLVSRGLLTNGLLGMAKCLIREPGGEKIRILVDPEGIVESGSDRWKEIVSFDLAFNVAQNGEIGTMRHLPLLSTEKQSTDFTYLNVLTRGDLASLTWLRAPEPKLSDDASGSVFCTVNYAPLNFRDIMLASGKLPPDALPGSLAQKECILGLEFAGYSEDGNRVMGLVTAGGLASSIYADPYLMWKVPKEWTLKEAATVPVVYSTAYYALVVRGGLQPGESVLIHAGSGGVGQAAISIALSRGCVVYTTVSTEKKRDFLKKKFPQLTDKNFANSRDATFEYHILEQTAGLGVDLVLNSLAGELLQASVRCLKEHGRFLEIGKADLANNTALGMSIFLKNVTFHGILLDALFEGSDEKKKELQKVVYDGIAAGEVKPLASTTYTYQEAEEAFRFMASGKHIGKVLLEISPEAEQKPKKPKRKSNVHSASADQSVTQNGLTGIPAAYKFWAKPNLVYVITGGLGGLGLEIADWLLARGATKIVLTSRRGVSTGYQALCVKRWTSSGANVRVLTQDASTVKGAEKLIQEAAKEGPIGGIFHLAVILEDSVFENQSADQFQRVAKVKANGAMSLDSVSRKMCPELHVWVTFSSVACGRGNAGQSNYGWANSVSERVVEKRVADGFPGCAIQWGGIADVGVLADTLGNVEVGGTKPQSLRSVLAVLDNLIGSGIPVVQSICLSSKKSSGRDGKGGKSIVASLANILGIRDISKAPVNVSLGDLGMDSLMAVEIKQTLEREADVVLTTEQIRELTLNHIKEIEQGSASESSSVCNGVGSSLPNVESFSWINFPLVPKDDIRMINEVKGDFPPLFIASPIQGTCDVLSQVASSIQTNVFGLEYSPKLSSTDICSIATKLMERIEQVVPDGNFHLAGYSYGAGIAYEIAVQFERKGRKPRSLTLLDGSHKYVSGIIDSYRNKYFATVDKLSSEDEEVFISSQGQSDSLLTYTLQYCAVDPQALRSSLLALESFDQRLDLIAETIINHVESQKIDLASHLTAEEIKCSASQFYDRLVASFFRKSTSVEDLDVATLLIRATQNNHQTKFGADYGLSQVVKNELTVKEIQGTHESIILGDNATKTAQFVNEFLSLHK